jgi:hypothetical protein
MLGTYLRRRGKRLFCDKSLGTARYADLLLRVYPKAKFLCLYRHPMDVIRSGIEACPWGLNGYGFDSYIADTPGNAVLALARYWVDNTSVILDVEDRHPDHCQHVRYEDLVSTPDKVADEIFAFIGVPAVAGISRECFALDRERFGPADFKIWNTSAVTGDSVGRGAAIPAGLIPPHVRGPVNELADRLGYIRVDEQWGTASMPGDLRAGSRGQEGELMPPAHGGPGHVAPGTRLLGNRLKAGLARIDDRFAGRWGDCAAECFELISCPHAWSGDREERWRIELATAAMAAVRGGQDSHDWSIVGSAAAWESVLRGEINLNVALRRYDLRYCDEGHSGLLTPQTRIGMVADLLGLASWRSAGNVP